MKNMKNRIRKAYLMIPALLATAAVPLMAWGGRGGFRGGGPGGFSGGGPGAFLATAPEWVIILFTILRGVVPILVVLGVILIILKLIKRRGNAPLFGSRCRCHRHGGKALSILSERYARGEIDEEQYKKMRSFLESDCDNS